jgi:Transcriptional regulator/sugar kinase
MKHQNFLGIDLGGTKLLLVAGEHKERVATGVDFKPQDLYQAVNSFLTANQITIEGIGLAVPGLISSNQLISCDVLPHFSGWSPDFSFLKKSLPVFFINDVRAALLGLYPNPSRDFTGGVVFVGTAIGSAWLVKGLTLEGEKGWAGELGYFPIEWKGRVYRLDEIAGGRYMAEKVGLDGFEMFYRALEGDPNVVRVVKEGGYSLGMTLAGMINLFNPAEIVLGGGTIKLPHYWEEVQKAAKKHTIPSYWKNGLLKKWTGNDELVAIGAIEGCIKLVRKS